MRLAYGEFVFSRRVTDIRWLTADEGLTSWVATNHAAISVSIEASEATILTS